MCAKSVKMQGTYFRERGNQPIRVAYFYNFSGSEWINFKGKVKMDLDHLEPVRDILFCIEGQPCGSSFFFSFFC